jgi:RNA polymerase sigma factor (sigma-70 family)
VSDSETNRQQFARVFRDHSGRVYRFARRHCDPATAQDITSETFTIAWRRFERVPPEPLPWLFAIARNVLRNQVRGDRRRDRLVASLTSSPATRRTGPAADLELLERARLTEALTRLTDREREALVLVAWDGFSTAQCATITGCSANAFAARLSRARARLALALRDDDPEPPGRSRVIDVRQAPTLVPGRPAK